MRLTLFPKIAAAILALTVFATPPARAEDDDDECQGVVESLKKYGDRMMKSDQKATPKAVCAGLGKMVGLSRAIHEIANQCMEEGKKRDELMTEMAQVQKIFESEIEKECQ